MILCSAKHFESLIRIREAIFLFLTLNVYFPFCKAVYAGQGAPLGFSELKAFPKGSLGYCAAEFLIAFALLGIPANMKGEICMQYFEFGNGNRSIPVITVMTFGTLFMPEEWREYQYQYRRGKAAVNLSKIDLKGHAEEAVFQLKNKWNL